MKGYIALQESSVAKGKDRGELVIKYATKVFIVAFSIFKRLTTIHTTSVKENIHQTAIHAVCIIKHMKKINK